LRSKDLDTLTSRKLISFSHDRWFLDRIAHHILAFKGNSQVTFFNEIIRNMMPTRRSA